MAFSENFSISQTALNPALVIATDTSTGSDPAISQRRIFLQTQDGTYLVESGTTINYNPWALITNPLILNLLTTDQAVSIQVQWLDVSNNVLYSKTQAYALVYFNKSFFYYLIQQQGLTPNIVQDTNYFSNLAMLWTTIIGAENAVQIGNDISAGQSQINIGTNLRLNESLYF